MKSQISFDYYITLIIFIIAVTYFFFQISSSLPPYLKIVEEQSLKLEAYQISQILINDPGEPEDWYLDPEGVERIGLMDEKYNKMNLISLEKALKLNEICSNNYEKFLESLDIEVNVALTLIDKTNGKIILECKPQEILPKERFNVKRFLSFQNGFGELLVEVW